MSSYNDQLLDSLTLLSFIISLENLNQNLSQSDKDDIMQQLDTKTTNILTQIEKDLDEQNNMLKEILKRVKNIENEVNQNDS